MAKEPVTDEMMSAAREFDSALVSVGFKANVVMWAVDHEVDQAVLVVLTDFYDFEGPLAILEMIFKAYRKSLLPKAIDPFSVRVHSVDQKEISKLCNVARGLVKVQKGDARTRKGEGALFDIDGMTVSGLEAHTSWLVSQHNRKKADRFSMRRQWSKISERIDAIAA